MNIVKTEIKKQFTIRNNITIDIDQDPINQLVLMLQTSYSFKSVEIATR